MKQTTITTFRTLQQQVAEMIDSVQANLESNQQADNFCIDYRQEALKASMMESQREKELAAKLKSMQSE